MCVDAKHFEHQPGPDGDCEEPDSDVRVLTRDEACRDEKDPREEGACDRRRTVSTSGAEFCVSGLNVSQNDENSGEDP